MRIIAILLLALELGTISQMAFAAIPRIPCFTVIERSRAERMLLHDRTPQCDPAFIPTPGEMILCPTNASRRRAERMQQRGLTPFCTPTRAGSGTSSSSSSQNSSSSSSSSMSSSISSTLDTRDTSLRSQFALLGEISSILGSASFFSNDEALDVREISVTMTGNTPSVSSLLVYDDSKRYLGRATRTTGNTYRLTLTPGTFEVGRRTDESIYVRADFSAYQNGGVSDEDIQISSVTLGATGVWTSETYSTTSTSTFPYRFVTARGSITSVVNALGTSAPLTTGVDRVLGSFTFTGRKTDPSARVDVTDLTFTLGTSGGVSLTNVAILTEGIPDRHSCTVSSSTITCSGIPATFGSLDSPRTLTLRGDVTATDTSNASLQVSLNQQGTPSSAGAVTWTDGTSTFTWLPLPNASSIANGTYWSY